MHLFRILSLAETTDEAGLAHRSGRRRFVQQLGRGLLLAAGPLALGAVPAGAQGNAALTEALNAALWLEYFSVGLYGTAAEENNLLPDNTARTIVQILLAQERAHAQFLNDTIISQGGTPLRPPTFDFTGGGGSHNGPFPDVFSNYLTFLQVAQLMEDLSVRAYQDSIARLSGDRVLRSAALQILSVEGRHAAQIRQLRRVKTGRQLELKPWVRDAAGDMAGATAAAVYAGENNVSQAGLDLTAVSGLNIAAGTVTEAFDEPLDAAAVSAILAAFTV